jgi:sulfur carrier protein ThiS
MSESKTSAGEILVHLVSPGVGERDFRLSEGATLADLLSQSGTSTTNQTVFVDGFPPEATLPLRSGVVVTVVPRLRNASGEEPWRATIPAFQDEALLQEYSEILEARRREAPSDEVQGG